MEKPWGGHTYYWGRNLCQQWVLVMRVEVGGRGGRYPCGTYLPAEEYVWLCPLNWGGPVGFMELDWGVTVNREPSCPAALHPRCGAVDICLDSCLKVGHWPWCILFLWWFSWSLVVPCPLWRSCKMWCCVLSFESD